jgi:hypothetical protein
LWCNGIDDNAGTYQGYYDDNIGTGEDIEISGRGSFPERYLFRLPVFDCYLTDEHNSNVITMGPKLTNNEIQKIDELAEKLDGTSLSYKKLHGTERPSLQTIKKLYDQAISKNNREVNDKECHKQNKLAVEQLKKL